jgi:hypothetical protein
VKLFLSLARCIEVGELTRKKQEAGVKLGHFEGFSKEVTSELG